MIAQLKAVARRILRPPLHAAEVRLPHKVLGTDYGGWPLLTEHTPHSPLVFAFGVGEDISFDLAAIEQFGATVHAFDPTPRCRAWVERQTLPAAFHFHPIGLAAEDGEAEFFAPEKDVNVSFSAQPGPQSDRSLAVTAPVKRLSTIIAELGTAMPDVLKMDIEGFEYGVLDDMIASDLRPAQLLVEFHHRMYDIPNQRTLDQIERLRAAGYRIFHVADSGHEYGLVHQRVISG
jgi:FkbM family methyltransferase